jgi:hypothetical protein
MGGGGARRREGGAGVHCVSAEWRRRNHHFVFPVLVYRLLHYFPPHLAIMVPTFWFYLLKRYPSSPPGHNVLFT